MPVDYLVTGANRGIGLEFVRQIVARGESVVATARYPEEALVLQEIAAGAPDRVEILQLDLNEDGDLSRLRDSFAGRSLSVLINNAGVMNWAGALGELNYETINTCMLVNAYGPLRVVEAVLPALKRSKVAKVVNMSSNMASIAENSTGTSYAYRMSKAALNMAVRSMSIDLKSDKIIVFSMHPGWVKTRMGGPDAPIDVDASVASMLRIIDDATSVDNGRFWDFEGKRISW